MKTFKQVVGASLLLLIFAGCEQQTRVRLLDTGDEGEASLTIGGTAFSPGCSVTLKNGAKVYFMPQSTNPKLLNAMHGHESPATFISDAEP